MREPTKEGVLTAAATLVELEDTERVNRWITLLEPVVDSGVELLLEGESAFLQPMLELRRKDIDRYADVMKRIDEARVQQGNGKLAERKSKTAYLADYMREKRAREVRIVNLWNEMFGDRDRLRGKARNAFMVMHARRWNVEREARMDALRKRLGRALSIDEVRTVVETLHDDIDAELDALELFIRQEMQRPLSQRNPNGFEWRVGKL